MAAEKKPIIVIKKVTVNAAGHHGGSWKVAFADFMTALMAFFLVMWLVGQSDEVKENIAEYFSTPSIIEYNFSNYGVELTLEKLFLDLMNEPLRAFEQFIRPAERTPNIMDMGTTRITRHYMAEQLAGMGAHVDVSMDEIVFDIPEEYLFDRNSARPSDTFVGAMSNIRAVVEGLKDTDIFINSELPVRQGLTEGLARNIAEERLDLIMAKVDASLRGDNVDLYGKTTVETPSRLERRRDLRGMIRFRIKQKDFKGESQRRQRASPSQGVETSQAPEPSSSAPESHQGIGSVVDDLTRSPSSQ